MNEKPCCEQCGKPLPPCAPGGLCPTCLLGQAVAVSAAFVPVPQPSSRTSALPAAPSPVHRFGDYELLEKIAEGGMGVVYRALQLSLNRVVAVKLIQPARVGSSEMVLRFRAEAEAAAGLHHPNIVAIHETGECEGQFYFSMDYIEGKSLAQKISDFEFQIADFRQAARWIKTIAEAIQYAHQQGILHRDLKPSNIIVDAAGEPHITDFGLARRLAGDSTLTLTGQVFGSPSFIPPEQAAGRRGAVGVPGDVYGLGAILYFALTGRPPFVGESLETTLLQVLQQEPVGPRLLNASIPRDLETIYLKCLEKEPARRYSAAQALANELDRFLKNEPILARPPGTVGKAWKWCRRRPVLAGLSTALVASFLLGTAGVLWQWRQTRDAKVEAERREYAANISLVQSLIGDQQFDRAREILSERTPEPHRNWEWGWLQRQCNQDLMTLTDRDYVGCLFAVFDPGTRLLATQGGSNTDVSLWDLATGKKLRTLTGHTASVYRASFSPDGRQLATCSPWDTRVIIWDVATGRELQPLVHAQGVPDVTYNPDGKRLATACWDGKVRLWDTGRWICIDESPPYDDHIYCARFSPDGRRIAYGGGYAFWANSRNTAVCIWDLSSRKVQPLVGHTQAVPGVTWHPSSNLLASCALDGQVMLWDTASGQRLKGLAPGAKRGTLYSIEFSPNGRSLAIAGGEVPSFNAWAQVLDAPSLGVRTELPGHSKGLTSLAFSRDGLYLATAGGDGKARVWAADPLPSYLSLEGHDQIVCTVAFSTNGNYVATGSLDQTVKIWDANTGVLVQTISVNFPVVSLAFSPTGDRLVTVGPDHTACVWNLTRGAGILPASVPEPLRLCGHSRTVMSVAWSPDNRWIATGGKDNQVILWHAATGREFRRFPSHTNWVLAMAFSPNSKLLATGSADATIRLWDIQAGQCRRTLTNHTGGVLSLAFSPDERLLASGGADAYSRLWEVRSGRELPAIKAFINGVTAVAFIAFSPDSTRLVTVASGSEREADWSQESRIRLWDVSSGQELLSFLAHTNAVYCAAFSPDGRRIATGSGDNTARIWTAFPWKSTDYPGNSDTNLAARIEDYKRRFWQSNLVARRAANLVQKGAQLPRHIGASTLADLNLPPAGTKRRPLGPIPLRSAQAGAGQLDLTDHYNVALDESWQPLESLYQLDLSLAALPSGLQTFERVQFDVRGLIQLRRGALDCELFPEQVAIPVKRTFKLLHALHGTRWADEERKTIAALVLHYSDGAEATLPIKFGEHLRQEKAARYSGEMIRTDNQPECTNGAVAWLGPPPERPWDVQLRLYKTTFRNPRPTMEVDRIEYLSKVTRSAPFLVALTVE
jgi:WD40 repeat protein